MTKNKKNIPVFYGLRVIITSSLLYYLLVLPFLMILFIKYAPSLIENNNELSKALNSDSLQYKTDSTATPEFDSLLTASEDRAGSYPDSIVGAETAGKSPEIKIGLANNNSSDGGTGINKGFNLIFNLILAALFLSFLFNIPFKRYLKRKAKGKTVSEKNLRFVKKYILRVPAIQAGLLSLAFGIAHGWMFIRLIQGPQDNNLVAYRLFTNFFFISLIAAILSVLFVYFWHKNRVHTRYIGHFFSTEELRKRIFGKRTGHIRNRLLLSGIMTTLLPLTIVLLYIFLSLSHISDLHVEQLTEDHYRVLFGEYLDLANSVNISPEEGLPGFLFYINLINSFFMLIGIFSSVLIAFFYILFLVRWTTLGILQPVGELLDHIRRTGRGELEEYTLVRTNDEIGELSEGFNEMTARLARYIRNISEMNKAYYKFVPEQFLAILGKENFTQIRLGDQTEKVMTVMFCDIRSFTTLSEEMTPAENFRFINAYLGYMEPVIRGHKGFIDKYIGDAIMALFDGSPDHALEAAISMRRQLQAFNEELILSGRKPIDIGIGIHTGRLMLGIVGSEERMNGTVVSDAVNLASRLEGLTKSYGKSIICSENTFNNLEKPERFAVEYLDEVMVKGKKKAVKIYFVSEKSKVLKEVEIDE